MQEYLLALAYCPFIYKFGEMFAIFGWTQCIIGFLCFIVIMMYIWP